MIPTPLCCIIFTCKNLHTLKFILFHLLLELPAAFSISPFLSSPASPELCPSTASISCFHVHSSIVFCPTIPWKGLLLRIHARLIGEHSAIRASLTSDSCVTCPMDLFGPPLLYLWQPFQRPGSLSPLGWFSASHSTSFSPSLPFFSELYHLSSVADPPLLLF